MWAKIPLLVIYTSILLAKVPSGKSVNLKVTTQSSTSIKLSWYHPENFSRNGIIQNYTIIYQISDTDTTIENTTTTNATIFTAEGLQPFTTYNFSVYPNNQVGRGKIPAIGSNQTFEDAPGQVELLRTKNITTTSVTLLWNEPNITNGIVYYRICYNGVENETSITNITISGLEEYVRYEFSVLPFTKNGGDGASKVINVTTLPTFPSGEPENLKVTTQSSTSIKLWWDHPENFSRNGIIKNYTIIYQISDTDTTIENTTTTNATIFTAVDLQPFTTYNFSVYPNNQVGRGKIPAIGSNKTFEDAPGQVELLRTMNITTTSVTLLWKEPNITNGIVYYRIFYNGVENETSITNITISGLEEYVRYEFVVIPFTKNGGDGTSKSINVSTLPTFPSGKPVNLKVTTQSSTSIKLSWYHPENFSRNGIIQNYTIIYQISDTDTTIENTTTTNATIFTAEGLQPFTTYNFSIYPNNQVGRGRIPAIGSNQTFEDAPGQVELLRTMNITTTSVTLLWKEPNITNGIVYYRISYNGVENETSITNITISGLEEYVRYEFVVLPFTKKGGDGTSKTIHVTTLPTLPSGKPENLKVTTQSSNSIKLSWYHPEIFSRNGIIQNYTIIYQISDTDTTIENTTTTNATIFTAEGLQPFTTYHFSVYPNNQVGRGKIPAIGSNQTFEDAPGQVELLRTMNVTTTSVTLLWKEPNITNGVVYYRISYNGVENETPIANITISGLEEYVRYEFAVLPFTKNGGDGTSKTIHVTTLPTLPSGKPVNLKVTTQSSTSIKLSWYHPENFSRNGIIQNYTIIYQISDTDTTIENTTTTNATIFTAEGLQPFTTYHFSVYPNNQVGRGKIPAIGSNQTFEDVPGKPNSFECVTVSNQSIYLNWTNPNQRNGIITKFLLQGKYLRYKKDKFSFLHENLKAFTNYTYNLSASTSIGFGESINVTCATFESVPDAPAEVNVTDYGARWVMLTWKPPAVDKGIITGYKVKFLQNTDPEVDVVVNGTQFNVTQNIRPYKTYHILLAARTSKGFGPPATAYVLTQQAAPTSVIGLKARNILSTSVILVWEAPLEMNGNVSYHVFRDAHLVNTTIETQLTVDSLYPYQRYHFAVQAFTVRGASPLTNLILTTDSALPTGAPLKLNASVLNSTCVQLTWFAPPFENRNGLIDYYLVRYKDNENTVTRKAASTQYLLGNLTKYTKYCVSVSAHNDKGLGPEQDTCFTTDEDKPGPPHFTGFRNVSDNENRTEVEVSWQAPNEENGEITNYNLRYHSKIMKRPKNLKLHRNKRKAIIPDLVPFTTYWISLSAQTSKGEGERVNATIRTDVLAPYGPPLDFKITNGNATSLRFAWKPPTHANGPVVKYLLECELPHHESDDDIIIDDGTTVLISPFHPFTRYCFKLRCVSAGGEGPKTPALCHKTDPAAPPLPIKVSPSRLIPTLTKIPFKLSKASNMNGIVQYYLVIVVEAYSNRSLPNLLPSQITQLKTYDEYIQNRKSGHHFPYIAAKVNSSEFPRDGNFWVGDLGVSSMPNMIGDFRNGPLIPKTSYYVSQRSHVNDRLYVSSEVWEGPFTTVGKPIGTNGGNGGAIAGSVIAVFLIAFLVAALYYFRYYKPRNGSIAKRWKKSEEEPLEGKRNAAFDPDDGSHRPPNRPIRVEDFGNYVKNLAKDGKYLYSEEFKIIQNGGKTGNPRTNYNFMYEHSNHPINRDKNRYNNIVAYDHTRVLLRPLDGVPESDYINANYIDGYSCQSAYIATQGPLENTCEDFWRMCWEQNVTNIVMLTQLVEAGKTKCYKYWPEVGSMCYGMLQVTLTESTYLPSYVVRTFSVLHDEYPGSERFMRHFAFNSWPDHRTSNPQTLLSFIRHINQSKNLCEGLAGPTVVHCSAGVGRTGTYIVLDGNLQRIASENTIEIFNYLSHIRTQRNYMVQTGIQYEFIHETLHEYLTFGVTEVQVQGVREHVKKLNQPQDGGPDTLLDREFHKLNLFDQSSTKTMNAASENVNKSKNRFLNVLPYDCTRVILQPLPSNPGSDYINANYINGYSQTRQFIATQAPLPQTIPAFWRMMWEHQSVTVVCLTKETEGGRVKTHRYWPSIEAAMHGPLMIEQLSQKDFGDFTVREFKVTHTTEGHSRNIKHFQYVAWPESQNAYPECASGLVEMIGQVQKWHQQDVSGQIVVHCSAGVGRSGVFIALCNMIERVRIEGVVDVFQTVRELRNQRPAMVQTKAQYLFCYLALQDFLASFDIYMNITLCSNAN